VARHDRHPGLQRRFLRALCGGLICPEVQPAGALQRVERDDLDADDEREEVQEACGRSGEHASRIERQAAEDVPQNEPGKERGEDAQHRERAVPPGGPRGIVRARAGTEGRGAQDEYENESREERRKGCDHRRADRREGREERGNSGDEPELVPERSRAE